MNDWDDDEEMTIEFIPEDWVDEMNSQEELCLILTLFAKCMDEGLDEEKVYQAIYTLEHGAGINYDNVSDLVELVKGMRKDGRGSTH